MISKDNEIKVDIDMIKKLTYELIIQLMTIYYVKYYLVKTVMCYIKFHW